MILSRYFSFSIFLGNLCLLFFANKRGRRHSVRIDVAAGLLICSTYDRCRLKNGLGTLSPSGVYFGFFLTLIRVSAGKSSANTMYISSLSFPCNLSCRYARYARRFWSRSHMIVRLVSSQLDQIGPHSKIQDCCVLHYVME